MTDLDLVREAMHEVRETLDRAVDKMNEMIGLSGDAIDLRDAKLKVQELHCDVLEAYNRYAESVLKKKQ